MMMKKVKATTIFLGMDANVELPTFNVEGFSVVGEATSGSADARTTEVCHMLASREMCCVNTLGAKQECAPTRGQWEDKDNPQKLFDYIACTMTDGDVTTYVDTDDMKKWTSTDHCPVVANMNVVVKAGPPLRMDNADPNVYPKHEKVAKSWKDNGGFEAAVDTIQVRNNVTLEEFVEDVRLAAHCHTKFVKKPKPDNSTLLQMREERYKMPKDSDERRRQSFKIHREQRRLNRLEHDLQLQRWAEGTEYGWKCKIQKRSQVEYIQAVEDGRKLTGPEEIAEAFKTTLAGIYGEVTEHERHAQLMASIKKIEDKLKYDDDEGKDVFRNFSSEEVWTAVLWLKKGRSGGIDGLVAEVLQALGEPEIDCLTELLNARYKGDCSPPLEWLWTKVLLIGKSRYPKTVDDFRPVSLSNTVQKIYFKVLLKRLQEHLPANPYKSHQCGNRKATDAAEVTQTLRLIFELGNHFDEAVFVTKIDLRKAFDTLYLDAIKDAFVFWDVPEELQVAFLREYAIEDMFFLLGSQKVAEVRRKAGVKQGGCESGFLFQLAVDVALRPLLEKWHRQGRGVT
ncbi:MAG: reverse transcriptase domain-containing protein, partial [Candidatus Woesearchaeota archaeon]|nr:reverse transcriptase domain-containing protein [Candidatus Woesearchaeota archaeon]